MEWLLLILGSAFLLGLYAPMMKHMLGHEKLTQIGSLYPLVAVALLAILYPIDYSLPFSDLGWLVLLKSASIALTIFSANLALAHLPVSIYAPMRNISPIFLLIFSYFLLGESIDLVQIFGLFMIVIGAVLLDVDIRKKGQLRQVARFFKQPAILLLFIAAFIVSFAAIFDRILLRSVDAPSLLFWYLLIMAAMFWVVNIIRERQLPFIGIEKQEWLWIVMMGVVILLSDLLYFKAVQVPGTIIVVLIGTRRLANLVSTIIGGHAFHEKDVPYKAAMCLVMILGTVLLVL
jgi:transporter family protein